MFKTLQSTNNKNLNHSGKSLVGETLQIEGNIKSSGSIEVAGLINGNAFVDDVTITETGSIRGTIEAKTLEVNGHIEGKVIADTIIINKNAIKPNLIKRKPIDNLCGDYSKLSQMTGWSPKYGLKDIAEIMVKKELDG